MRTVIYVEDLLREARDLASEDAENPEYDRALVELVTRVTGGSQDDQPEIAALILPQPDRWAVERRHGIGYFGDLWKN